MRYGAELNLSSVEKECIWHLLDHDHNGKGYSYPSEATIAKRMKLSERYVREIILRLEKRKDLITVKRIAGASNQYRYHGIMKAMHVFLDRENGRSKKRVQKSENQLSLIDESTKQPRNPSSAHTQEPQFRPPRNPSSGVPRNPSSAHPGTTVPSNTAKNSANRTLQDNSLMGNGKFDELLEFWNGLEIIVHTIAPRDGQKTFFDSVNARLEEGHTWDDFKTAAQNYHDILISSEHRFKFRWTITQFVNRGLDQFLDRKAAWENYKNSNFNERGKSFDEQQRETLEYAKRRRQEAGLA